VRRQPPHASAAGPATHTSTETSSTGTIRTPRCLDSPCSARSKSGPPIRLPGQQRFYTEILVYLAQAGNRGADRYQLTEASGPINQSNKTVTTCAPPSRPHGNGSADKTTVKPGSPTPVPTASTGSTTASFSTPPYSSGYVSAARRTDPLESKTFAPRSNSSGVHHATDRPVVRRPHPQTPYTRLPVSDLDPEDLQSTVIDVAHRMAGVCLSLGDTASARWAVTQGCLTDPGRDSDDLDRPDPHRTSRGLRCRRYPNARLHADLPRLRRPRGTPGLPSGASIPARRTGRPLSRHPSLVAGVQMQHPRCSSRRPDRGVSAGLLAAQLPPSWAQLGHGYSPDLWHVSK
jgi:hypothetical protein